MPTSVDILHKIVSQIKKDLCYLLVLQKDTQNINHRGRQDATVPFLFGHVLLYPSHLLNPTHGMSTSLPEGRREEMLAKQRLQMKEDFERQKANLISETEKSRPSSNRFTSQNDSMEDTLKHSTVGLVKLEDFQQKRKALEEAKAREAARTNELK